MNEGMQQPQIVGYANLPQVQPSPKIQTAVNVVFFFADRILGGGPPNMAGTQNDGRQFTTAEARVYDSALAALAEYFNSDETCKTPVYGIYPPRPEPPPPTAMDPQPVHP